MYTRPSIADLLEGLTLTLDQHVIPLLEGNPDAQRLAVPLLAVLDRVAAEWHDRALRLTEDTKALAEGLTRLVKVMESEPDVVELTSILSRLDPVDPGASVAELIALNNAHKSAFVEVIRLLDLPAETGASSALKAADGLVLELLLAFADRELAAVPALDLSAVAARNNHGMASLPIGDMPQRLQAYLEHTLTTIDGCKAGSVKVSEFQRLDGGNSRDTYLFDLSYKDSADVAVFERCVMQREAVSSLLDTDDEEGHINGTRRRPETEFKAVVALAQAGLRVPEMLWCDPTGEWLDRPFTICRREEGTTSDVELRSDPAKLSVAYEDYVQTLVQLHSIDPHSAGLAFLGETTPETAALDQVQLFEAAFRRNALEAHPGVEYLIAWLKKNPPAADVVSVIHGDFRRGNFMHVDGQITAYIDWEQVHLGDPVEEIAFMYWALWSLEPIIPLEEFLHRYEAAAGRRINRDALAFYRLFQELKMLVVGVTGFKSFFATASRQLQYTNPYFHTYTTACWQRALKELAAGGPTYDYPAAKDAPIIY